MSLQAMAQPFEIDGAMKSALRPFGQGFLDTQDKHAPFGVDPGIHIVVRAVQVGNPPARGDLDALSVRKAFQDVATA